VQTSARRRKYSKANMGFSREVTERVLRCQAYPFGGGSVVGVGRHPSIVARGKAGVSRHSRPSARERARGGARAKAGAEEEERGGVRGASDAAVVESWRRVISAARCGAQPPVTAERSSHVGHSTPGPPSSFHSSLHFPLFPPSPSCACTRSWRLTFSPFPRTPPLPTAQRSSCRVPEQDDAMARP